MSQIISLPPGTPRADQESAFAALWREANRLAPGQIKNAGGYRIRVPDDVAGQLRQPDGGSAPDTAADAPATTEGAIPAKAPARTRKAPAKKASKTRKAAPVKKAASKTTKKAPAKKAATPEEGTQ